MTNIELLWQLVPIEFLNTLYMVAVSSVCSMLIGLPLGVLLYQTQNEGLSPHYWTHKMLGSLVNIGRSIPFAILIVAMIPFTRLLIGTSIGTSAAIVPLTIAAAPFFARIVESALGTVNKQLLQAAQVMGSSNWQIISKVAIPEAMPELIKGITLTVVTLINYSTLAGLVGGGGLGKLAIQYGYQRFNAPVMMTTVVILLLLVEVTQKIGHQLVTSLMRKRGLL